MVFSQKVGAHYRELKQSVPDCLLLMQVDYMTRSYPFSNKDYFNRE